MSDMMFLRFQEVIMSELGINVTSAKKTMIQARLAKRLRIRQLHSYEEYFDYVFKTADGRAEIQDFIDVITTNKTDFFREPHHFDYLIGTALPQLLARNERNIPRVINLWSAGCSSGEEPYTLAMLMDDFIHSQPGINYSILASDICTTVLKKAQSAIYPQNLAAPIPLGFKKKYLLKSKDRAKNQVRIVPQLRSKVRFKQINFMDPDFDLPTRMDIIFFRNVIIYFDHETQQTVLEKMCRHLRTGGYLFIGHSETLSGFRLPLTAVGPTIYRKTA
ncbi:MAG: chemotaxis protein CheR [Proteobacteria bacterium]|nr:chemotaxis protein CheR [Pseudomonadota bacterium]MBU1688772.1 chemotaxis protein CheR [Pseudomonadota bacterium]